MNAKSKTSSALLLTVLLSAVFAVGCERRATDDQAAANSDSVGTSATDTTTAARAEAAGESSGSSGESGSSGTSDSSDTSTAVGGATSDSAGVPLGTSDTSSGGTSGAANESSDSSGASGSDSSGASSSDSSGASSSDTSSKAGAMVEDSVITTKLKAALLADTEIKGTKVEVETKQGQVTLTGEVKSQAQKDRVQQIAKGIDGVKGVQDNLKVQQ